MNDQVFPVECVSVGDKSALRPSGLRFGSPALTSRGLVQDDFKKVAEFIHRGNPLKYVLICPENVGSSSHSLPSLCSYHAEPGGAGKPRSQGSSQRIHSSIEAGGEVPAASSRNQDRGGSLCKSVPNAGIGWIVKGPWQGFGSVVCV